jgi:glycosyl transferase family 25
MSIDRLFSKTVCINLDRRPDRWHRMEARFSGLGMKSVERFPAVDGREARLPTAWAGMEGAYGCLLSHLAVVAAASADGAESLMIFEDDVEFAPDLAERFAPAFRELPDDWWVIYLGGFHRRPPVRVGGTLARATHTLSTMAYALRRPAFDTLLAFDSTRAEAIDTRLARLQAERVCHCVLENLAWPDCDFSDIQGAITNHWYIKESLVIGDTCGADMAGRVALVIPARYGAWRRADPGASDFLAAHFREAVPGLHLVVDDRGPPPGGPEGYARSASAGLGDAVDYLIVAGSPAFFSRSHLIGALEMCRKHPVVNPFAEVVALTPADARRVLAGDRKGLDLSRYTRESRDGLDLGWGFFRRDALGNERSLWAAPAYRVPSFALSLET